MNIKITGSHGYLAHVISGDLRKKGHEIFGIDRRLLYGKIEDLSKEIKNTDLLIHLAGARIIRRWTRKNKKIIYESRVITTRNIAEAIKNLSPEERPKKVISASAIGIYKSGKIHTEESTDYSNDFPGTLVRDWEDAWSILPETTALTIFRTAMVLGKESPAIKKLLVPFKLGLGAKIGRGRQPFPFINEKDVSSAYCRAAENHEMTGIFNLSAPEQINNLTFTRSLAKALHRPAFLTIPVFALKIIYGQAAGTLAENPAVIPKALKDSGFRFRYPTIEEALKDIGD